MYIDMLIASNPYCERTRMLEPPSRNQTPMSVDSATRLVDSLNLQGVAFLSKCFSDENRLRILLCVSRKEKSVSKIVEELGLSQPLVSHHLKELKRSFLVQVERRGPFIYYRSADERVGDILMSLSSLAEELGKAAKIF